MRNEELSILKNTIGQMACDADDKGLTDFCLRLSVADAFALCKLAQPRRWIPCGERLPEGKGWYLVYAPSYSGGSSSGLCNINGTMFAKWNGKNWSIEVGYHKRPGCVTHWQPIPRPPKEGDAENEL